MGSLSFSSEGTGLAGISKPTFPREGRGQLGLVLAI